MFLRTGPIRRSSRSPSVSRVTSGPSASGSPAVSVVNRSSLASALAWFISPPPRRLTQSSESYVLYLMLVSLSRALLVKVANDRAATGCDHESDRAGPAVSAAGRPRADPRRDHPRDPRRRPAAPGDRRGLWAQPACHRPRARDVVLGGV